MTKYILFLVVDIVKFIIAGLGSAYDSLGRAGIHGVGRLVDFRGNIVISDGYWNSAGIERGCRFNKNECSTLCAGSAYAE